MDLLGVGQDGGQLPVLAQPLLPGGMGAVALSGMPPIPGTGGSGGKPSALKSSSLSRLEELQAYLRQCDDQNYLKHYVKMLSAMPRELLDELTAKLKARSAWLSGEEQREYKRAKLLNVMGGPCSAAAGSPTAAALCSPGPCGGASSPGAAAARADADAFCSQVLSGGPAGGTPGPKPLAAAAGSRGGGMLSPRELLLSPRGLPPGFQLERLEMDFGGQGLGQPLVSVPAFVTPADARAWARHGPPPASLAQPAPLVGISPPAATGVTDHQIAEISPDAQPAAAGLPSASSAEQAAQLLAAAGRGSGPSGRGRQATLQDKTA